MSTSSPQWTRAAALALVAALGHPGGLRAAESNPPQPRVPATRLPILVPDDAWRPLYDHVDPALQAQLESALGGRAAWQSLVRRKKLAVGVVDLTDPADPRFARVNGNQMMYAASLPKIAILFAAHVAFENGTLQQTPEIDQDLTAMIRKSSNPAATRIIDLLGFEAIEAALRDPSYQLFDPKRGGGLWVGKRYAKEGRRHPDPLQGLSHGATVTQTCRFYYLLATGRLINPRRSRQMLDHLLAPELHHKFVSMLEQRAPRARLFRKSGTWRDWHSDSVLVWGDVWRRYILVSMVESPDGEQILRDLVPAIETVLSPPAAP